MGRGIHRKGNMYTSDKVIFRRHVDRRDIVSSDETSITGHMGGGDGSVREGGGEA